MVILDHRLKATSTFAVSCNSCYNPLSREFFLGCAERFHDLPKVTVLSSCRTGIEPRWPRTELFPNSLRGQRWPSQVLHLQEGLHANAQGNPWIPNEPVTNQVWQALLIKQTYFSREQDWGISAEMHFPVPSTPGPIHTECLEELNKQI